ncbi:MAG: hypothetical protein ABIL58_13600 [Pseudomonadota bacterium]
MSSENWGLPGGRCTRWGGANHILSHHFIYVQGPDRILQAQRLHAFFNSSSDKRDNPLANAAEAFLAMTPELPEYSSLSIAQKPR